MQYSPLDTSTDASPSISQPSSPAEKSPLSISELGSTPPFPLPPVVLEVPPVPPLLLSVLALLVVSVVSPMAPPSLVELVAPPEPLAVSVVASPPLVAFVVLFAVAGPPVVTALATVLPEEVAPSVAAT